MGFHEKSSWVMVLSLLAGAAFYIYFVVMGSRAAGMLVPPVLPVLIAFTVILVLLAVVGHILAALSSVRDANAGEDERDRLIARRAASASGALLSLGVLAALSLYLFTYQGDWLFYGVFASLVLASISEYAVRIVLYRFG
ncbi:MAG: hypothetical protein AAGA68_15925 [Pseudomonadota bacterium]